MRLANKEDFHGAIYSNYRHHEGYAKRAKLLTGFPDPFLIIGCGFGFLVDELRKLDRVAVGIDASEWAVTNKVNDYVFLCDVTNEAECLILREELGPFETVVTEDMLPYLTDDEAKIAARNCAQLAPIVIHMVTESGQADLNYHSCAEWMRLTNQPAISLEGM